MQLANADAQQVAKVVAQIFGSQSGGGGRGGQGAGVNINVTADERTNSLIVSSSESDWRKVEPLIQKLDAARAPAGGAQPVVVQGTGSNVGGIALQDDIDSFQTGDQPAHLSQWYFADTVKASDGNLAVVNDPAAVARVQALLERLRANLGQRVAVGSRNIVLRPAAAKAAGIAWQTGPNGVRYAVANEGQLMGLLDMEQRQAAPDVQVALRGEVRQDAIVGTDAAAGQRRDDQYFPGRR